MKKLFLLMLATSAFTFTSCSDDDDGVTLSHKDFVDVVGGCRVGFG